MSKKSNPEPFACKFLYDDDCIHIFQIPSRLVKSYGDDLAPTATLRINHSGKCWKVSVEKFKGQYFFTDGWKEFAEEAGMKAREYFLFRAAGLCEFRISTDESDVNSGEHVENSEDGDSFSEGENDSRAGESCTYVTELRTHHKQKIGLSGKFIEQAGLKAVTRLILQNVEGRQWPVRLTTSCGKCGLSAGCAEFLIANKVTVGSIMSFKLVPGSYKTLEAKVIKQGPNKNALYNFVKRVGNRYEVFEPDKTSGLDRSAEYLHATSELGEGPQNSHETSEPTEGLENLHVLSKHSEGSDYYNKRSERIEETENAHKLNEHVEGSENSLKKRERYNRPENFKSLGNVKSENEDHFVEEEDGYGVESREAFSKKLKKHDAYKLDMPRHENELFKDTDRSKFHTSPEAIDDKELNSGDYAEVDSEDGNSLTYSKDGPSVGKSFTFTTEIKSFNRNKLRLPGKFIKRAGFEKGTGLILQNVEGRQWPVRLTNSRGTYSLTAGWGDFLITNKVTVGSTMLFSFISGSDKTLEARVIKQGTNENALFNCVKRIGSRYEIFELDEICDISRQAKNLHMAREVGEGLEVSNETSESDDEKELHSGDDPENLKDGDSFTDGENGPCVGKSFTFSTELKNYHKQGLRLPRKFIKQAGLEKEKGLMLQDAEGRHWPVRMTRPSDKCILTAGWLDFLITNKVTVGSLMSFKYVLCSDKIIEVRVIKQGTNENALFDFVKRKGSKYEIFEPDITNDLAREAKKLHTAKELGEGPQYYQKTSEPTEETEILHAMRKRGDGPEIFSEQENDIGAERWIFSKKLKKHNAYKLDIPRHISKVIEKTTSKEIKLLDCKGRKWPVRLEYRTCGAYTMKSGWLDFLDGNKVYIGSTISFEFIPSRDSNVLETRVMDNGGKGIEIFVKKANDRPPYQCSADGQKELAKVPDMTPCENPLSEDVGCSKSYFSPDSNNEELNSGGETETSENEDSFTDQENCPSIGKSLTFTIELKSYQKNRVVLPRKVAEQARLIKDKKIMLQNVDGRQWPVRLTERKRHGTYALSAGWLGFLVANKVSIGSIMSFKLISGSKNTVEVRVIKEGPNKNALLHLKRRGNRFEVTEPGQISGFASGEGILHSTSDKGKRPEISNNRRHCAEVPSGHVEEPHRSHGNITSEIEDDWLEEENGFSSGKRWIFSKHLKKHNAYKLDIPRDVSKIIEKATKGDIKLRDCKGRKWPVRLEHRKCGAYTMTAGWIDFLVGNKVYVRSTISFEYMPNKDKNVIEARITENGKKGTELFVNRAKGRSTPCQ